MKNFDNLHAAFLALLVAGLGFTTPPKGYAQSDAEVYGKAEVRAVKKDVRAIGKLDKKLTKAFQKSIKARENAEKKLQISFIRADFDADGDVDDLDKHFFEFCFLQGSHHMPPICSLADLDDNNVVDLGDYNLFSSSYVASDNRNNILGDFDHDGDVDDNDKVFFQFCWNQTDSESASTSDQCDVADFDQDGDVDLADLVRFSQQYERY
ncbi:MAG: hypothetical protein KDD42_08725 [Bdellovibrionales bacterium]|nr:hypothetical protein [Bdellovibrionales bacterium]